MLCIICLYMYNTERDAYPYNCYTSTQYKCIYGAHIQSGIYAHYTYAKFAYFILPIIIAFCRMRARTVTVCQCDQADNSCVCDLYKSGEHHGAWGHPQRVPGGQGGEGGGGGRVQNELGYIMECRKR